MSTRVFRSPIAPIQKNQLVSMRRKLYQLGFRSMSDIRGNELKMTVPPGFPSEGREVMTKAAGRSVARFVFTERQDVWELEQTLYKPMDMRGNLLLEAFPGKKHSLERRTYEATIIPVLDEQKAVAHIDDLNVFLAALDDDTEISEAVDAQKIKKQLQKMGKKLQDANSMVEDFLNYIKGFVTHCDELWAWQVQRLKSDGHARAMMGRLADKV